MVVSAFRVSLVIILMKFFSTSCGKFYKAAETYKRSREWNNTAHLAFFIILSLLGTLNLPLVI